MFIVLILVYVCLLEYCFEKCKGLKIKVDAMYDSSNRRGPVRKETYSWSSPSYNSLSSSFPRSLYLPSATTR